MDLDEAGDKWASGVALLSDLSWESNTSPVSVLPGGCSEGGQCRALWCSEQLS